MKGLKIINKNNQKGYHLNTYGNAVFVQALPLKVVLSFLCLCTLGTNWMIPIICKKIKSFWLRY
jgi:antibiotic biosynthesis monooxygenase (ABM) superfamily enzyme